nr:MAG TPA: Cro/C1-type HTH DNA-binding domain protein [Caudoviricetes sp.]
MKIDYSRLFEKLKSENITQKQFREDLKLPGGTLQKFRENKSTTLETLGRICEYLQCPIEEIVEIKIETNEEAKIELEAQIAELQAKLKNL